MFRLKTFYFFILEISISALMMVSITSLGIRASCSHWSDLGSLIVKIEKATTLLREREDRLDLWFGSGNSPRRFHSACRSICYRVKGRYRERKTGLLWKISSMNPGKIEDTRSARSANDRIIDVNCLILNHRDRIFRLYKKKDFTEVAKNLTI